MPQWMKRHAIAVVFVLTLLGLSSPGIAAQKSYKWERLPAAGPLPRARHSYAATAYNDTVWIYGGSFGRFGSSNDLSDLWSYKYNEGIFEEVFYVGAKPNPRLGTVEGSLTALNGSLYLFGGGDADALYNELWRFSIQRASWERLLPETHTSPWPEARRGACLFARGTQELIVMGGLSPYDLMTDVWKYDITLRTWSVISEGTGWAGGRGFSCDYDASADVVYLFGGEGKGDALLANDKTSVFNLTTNTFTTLTTTGVAPGRRALHSSFLHKPATGSPVLVVAWGEDPYLDVFAEGVHALDLGTLVWKKIAESGFIPEARHSTKLIALSTGGSNRDLALSMGGETEEQIINQVVMLNVSSESFTKLRDTQLFPLARRGAATAILSSQIYIFGGIDESNAMVHDMWRAENGVWEIVTAVGTVPQARVFATMATFGLQFYLFGGRSASGDFLGDLWCFSTRTLVWSDLTTSSLAISGNIYPSARYGHTMSLMNRELYLFGGLDGTAQSNELWKVEPRTAKWTKLEPTVKIIGNYSVLSNTHASYRTANQPIPRMFHSTTVMTRDTLDPISPHRLVLFGGMLDQELHDMWLYDPVRNSWSPRVADVLNIRGRHDATIFHNGDHIFVHGGDSYNILQRELLLADVPMLDANVTNSSILTFSTVAASEPHPPYLAGHTTVVQANSALVFGGFGTLPDFVSREHVGKRHFVYNTLWKLTMTPICEVALVDGALRQEPNASCFVCAPGSYAVTSGTTTQCVLCPAGTYSEHAGDVECLPCPGGFFNPLNGSQSHLQCTACPDGSYAPNNGSTTCLQCPAGLFCPIAALEPLASSLSSTSFAGSEVNQSQPPSFPRRNEEVQDITDAVTYYGWLVTGVLFAVLLAMAATGKAAFLSSLDLLYSDVHEPTNVHEDRMKSWPTPLGGAFTVAAALSCIVLLILVLLPWMDNVAETRSLIPNLALETADTLTLSSNFRVQVVALHYGDNCVSTAAGAAVGACAEGISVPTSGFVVPLANGTDADVNKPVSTTKGPAASFTCAKTGEIFNAAAEAELFGDSASDEAKSVCVVTWVCNGCALADFSTGVVNVKFEQEASYATSFRWNMSSSSGIEDENDVPQTSSLQGRLSPTVYTKSFRGTQPASVSAIAPQSLYSNLINLNKGSGYVLQFQGQTQGSEVTAVTFQDQHFLYIDFQFLPSTSTYEVSRSELQDVYTFVANALGTVSGQIGAVALVLYLFEMALVYVIKKCGPKQLQRDMIKMDKVREHQELEEQASLEEVLHRLETARSRSQMNLADKDAMPSSSSARLRGSNSAARLAAVKRGDGLSGKDSVAQSYEVTEMEMPQLPGQIEP